MFCAEQDPRDQCVGAHTQKTEAESFSGGRGELSGKRLKRFMPEEKRCTDRLQVLHVISASSVPSVS